MQTATTGGEGLDTFADATPIELPNTQGGEAVQAQNDPGLDTFANDEVILPDSMKEDTSTEGDKNGEKQESTEKQEDTQKPEDKGTLENKEDDEGTEKEDEGEEGDDSTSEEEESDQSEDSESKPEGKTIRVKNGDEALDLDENSTVPVKVKGKKEFVSLAELTKNYSGHKAWSEEIETAKSQQAEIKVEREQFENAKEQTRQHFGKIGKMVHDAFDNPEADPLEAMKYLVDLSGRNVLDFEKRMMEHSVNLANQFMEMDENQQALYWSQRENEILRNNQATQAKESEERTAQAQRNTEIAKVREQYGVTEQDYEAAQRELSDGGVNLDEVSPEQISKYVALKPLVREANDLVQEFEDDLTDDEMHGLITGTADTMFNFPELSKRECLRIAAKRQGFEIEFTEDLVDEVKKKTQKLPDRSKKTSANRAVELPSEDHFETFDDFDEMYYKPRS